MSSRSLLEHADTPIVWDDSNAVECTSPVARASYAPLDDGEGSTLLASGSGSSGASSSSGGASSAAAAVGAAVGTAGRRIAASAKAAVQTAEERRRAKLRNAALEKQKANNAKFMEHLVSEEDKVFGEIKRRREQERRDAEMAARLGAREAARAPPPQRQRATPSQAKAPPLGADEQLRVRVKIPVGTTPGGRFTVELPGRGRIVVEAPLGTSVGDEIQFVVPARRSSSGGAASSSSSSSSSAAAAAAPAPVAIEPRAEDIAAMAVMGFAEQFCARALAMPPSRSGATRRSVEEATDWLLQNIETLEREAASEAAAAAASKVAAASKAAAAPPALEPAVVEPAAPVAPVAPAAPQSGPLARLQTAKAMLEAELITQQEYDETKRDILAALKGGAAAPAAPGASAPAPAPVSAPAPAPAPQQALAEDLLELL